MEINGDNIPGLNPKRVKHLIFATDGNRRWAYENNCSFAEAYKLLSETITNVIEWSLNGKGLVDEVTFWIMSEYNLGREEADLIIESAAGWIKAVCSSPTVKKLDLQVDIVGEVDVLRQKYKGSGDICDPLELVKGHKGKKVHLCLAYNGDKEILRAIKKCDESGIPPTFINIDKNWPLSSVDFFIRCGQPKGVNRVSEYFPGIRQARLFSTPTYPQEYTKKEFDDTISSFLTLKDSYDRMAKVDTYSK